VRLVEPSGYDKPCRHSRPNFRYSGDYPEACAAHHRRYSLFATAVGFDESPAPARRAQTAARADICIGFAMYAGSTILQRHQRLCRHRARACPFGLRSVSRGRTWISVKPMDRNELRKCMRLCAHAHACQKGLDHPVPTVAPFPGIQLVTGSAMNRHPHLVQRVVTRPRQAFIPTEGTGAHAA